MCVLHTVVETRDALDRAFKGVDFVGVQRDRIGSRLKQQPALVGSTCGHCMISNNNFDIKTVSRRNRSVDRILKAHAYKTDMQWSSYESSVRDSMDVCTLSPATSKYVLHLVDG